MNTLDPNQASQETIYPGNEQAGYEEQLEDPAIINMPSNPASGNDPLFFTNLAKFLDEGELTRIGNELTNKIQSDDDARQKWLRTVSEGIEFLGIGGDRSKNVYSARSSDVYAPTLLKCALNSCSEIFTQLFPSDGFIQIEALGLISEQIEQHADRIQEMMNYIITDVMEEYKPNKKQGLLWMILEGSVYTKVFIDRIKNKPAAPYIRASDVIIDFGASSLEDADRISHYFTLSERQLKDQFDYGDWKKVHVELADFQEQKVQQKVEQKIGVQSTVDDNNKYYGFYETFTYLDIPGFEHLNEHGKPSGRKLPYIVTKDKNSDSIVCIYRNWNENDPQFKAKKYLIQHKYFTGFDINGLGLIHLAIGLARAETDILKELLMAAQLANAPSLLMKSNLRNEKTQIDIKPGSLNQFQTFDSDLQSSLMPVPFNQPNPVLKDVMDYAASSITDFSAFNKVDPKNIPANMPAVTMLGVLSTMHILENSLMNDLYDSFKKEFQLLYNVIGEWIPDEGYPFALPGSEGVLMKQDFAPNVAIRPVMDPNISSSTQKLITGDAILKLVQDAPNLYDIREVHKRLLNSMKVNDVDSILKPPQEEQPIPELDPISENQNAMSGKPLKAYKPQDHSNHIIVHQGLVDTLSNDQTNDQTQVISSIKSHIQEHLTFQYVIHMEQMTGIQLPEDPTQIPEDVQNQIAIAAANVVQQQKQEQMSQNPPPLDPNQVMMEEIRVKEKEVDVRSHENETKIQLEQFKVQKDMEKEELKLQIELKRLELEERKIALEEMKLQIQHEDNVNKERVQLADIEMRRQNALLQAESKAYDSTLRHEFDKEKTYAEIASNEEKSHLDAQLKAYDSTLNFEKDQQKQEEPISDNSVSNVLNENR